MAQKLSKMAQKLAQLKKIAQIYLQDLQLFASLAGWSTSHLVGVTPIGERVHYKLFSANFEKKHAAGLLEEEKSLCAVVQPKSCKADFLSKSTPL